MLEIIPTVLLLSFIAAIIPGPLMALMIGETVKHGKVAGMKIGIAPLLTDLGAGVQITAFNLGFRSS